MAIASICGTLGQGIDQACLTNIVKKFYQQMVVINKIDINPATVVYQLPTLATPTAYNIFFELKIGKSGFLFKGIEANRTLSGMAEKSTGENIGSQYAHKVNYTILSASEQIKSILNSFDKGKYVVALQLLNGDVEVYGFENGLSSADYTYDIQGAGGATVLVLESKESEFESTLPLHFKSADPNADFDSLFAN